MIDRGGDARLVQEEVRGDAPLGKIRIENLDGDLAVKRDIKRAIDDGHAARSLGRFQQIVVEPFRDDDLE